MPPPAAHGVLGLIFLFFFAWIVPRMASDFAEMQTRLPTLTVLTIACGRFLTSWWFGIMPEVIGLDIGICLLLARWAGPVWLRVWLWLGLLGMGLALVLAWITLRLPVIA